MQPVTAPALARLLREADAETRGRFLADLYGARGSEAWVADGEVYVRATAPGDGTGPDDGDVRRLLVRTTVPDEVPAGVDAVVVTGVVEDPPAGVEDARAIRNLLLYGVDRERARALFESTFDRSLLEPAPDESGGDDGPATRERTGDEGDRDAAAGEPATGPLAPVASRLDGVRDRWTSARASGPSRRAWRAGAAAVALLALVVVGAVAFGGFPGGAVAGAGNGGGGGGAGAGADGTGASNGSEAVLPADAPNSRGESPGSAVAPDEDVAVVGSGERSGRSEANGTATDETLPPGGTTLPADHPRTLPPGIGPDGVTDEVALARAHARALENRSYRLTLVHRETVDGRPTGVGRETMRVENETRYASSVETVGDLRRDPLIVRDAAVYVNGTVRVERGTGVDGSGFGSAFSNGVGGDPADRVATYVRWFLSVEESRVVDTVERDGTRFFWLVLDGDPYPGVENTTGSALVDGTGLVHEIRRSYDYPSGDGIGATVTVRYDDLDATTVEAPEWYAEPFEPFGPEDEESGDEHSENEESEGEETEGEHSENEESGDEHSENEESGGEESDSENSDGEESGGAGGNATVTRPTPRPGDGDGAGTG